MASRCPKASHTLPYDCHTPQWRILAGGLRRIEKAKSKMLDKQKKFGRLVTMFAFHQPDYSTLNSSPDSKYTFLCLYRQTLPLELQLLEETPPAHYLKNNCWCSLLPKFWWWPLTSTLLNDNLSLCESSDGFSMCLQCGWFKRCEYYSIEFKENGKFWRAIS